MPRRRITTNWESQCIVVCSTKLPSTWSTAVHQSQTFPANVIYGQPLNITWLYHVTGSALSVVGPSLSQSLVWRLRTRYRTVSATQCSAATALDNRWRRTYFSATTYHSAHSTVEILHESALYELIIDIDIVWNFLGFTFNVKVMCVKFAVFLQINC